METAALVILSVVVLVLIALLIFQATRGKGGDNLQVQIDSLKTELQNTLSANIRHINSQLSSVTGQVAEQLSSVTAQLNSSTGQINTRMDSAHRAVGEVRQALGELSKSTEQVFELGKSISGLEKILAAPKLRGGLGEFFLADLLSQCLPLSRYELQYGFSDGARVDAVIKLNEGLVPIDSKFPLENFKKLTEALTDEGRRSASRKLAADCRKHIDAIASSYIRPSESTLSLALMYIPAEGVYYEFITMEDDSGKGLSSYALSKRVIPVSPNSFYAYLQTILMGLRGMEVGERAQEILAHINTLKQEFDKLSSDFETLGRHINFAKVKYDEVEKKSAKFSNRLELIGGEGDRGEKEPM
jgi:DNA recombination protein RmuC